MARIARHGTPRRRTQRRAEGSPTLLTPPVSSLRSGPESRALLTGPCQRDGGRM